ncbi:HD-GYP domain-containing protein [Paenibacillus sp. N1-5-1-14]|uniref:HD-GYP domain-containing protein n=1 Tax=Paenibacillus radicibacter TaxID=2972488 RepID=UPI0021592EC6|nr:HD-GYP domain-containing protein [Paenibacillus radicibacter]MCR8643676.1 HD-GYP domain-containing protein [Paenibacillus radicibacter]
MRIPVFDLHIGDQLTEDIYNSFGLHLLSAKTMINSNDIAYLLKHNIDMVSIEPRIGFSPIEEVAVAIDDPVIPEIIIDNTFTDHSSYFTTIAFEEAISGIKDLFEQTSLHNHLDASSADASFIPLITNVKMEKDVVSLLLSLNSNDDYTFQHSVQVGLICYFLATWLGKSEKEAKHISKAGYLHDIGKSKISEDILTKPGKLTDEEFTEMKNHTVYGYELILASMGDEELALSALEHHERMDGSGYPHGKQSIEIHPISNIVAVADIYSAMISNRVFQKKKDLLYVLKELHRMSFGQLDPNVVQVFIKNMVPNFIGKKITMESGETGKIIMINQTDFFRPLIQINDQFIDLTQNRNLDIQMIHMA